MRIPAVALVREASAGSPGASAEAFPMWPIGEAHPQARRAGRALPKRLTEAFVAASSRKKGSLAMQGLTWRWSESNHRRTLDSDLSDSHADV